MWQGSGLAEEESYLGLSLAELLDRVSAPAPAPGGGSVAAVAVGLAAALCAMAARLSTRQLAEAAALAATAEALRDRVASLAQADAVAYGAYMAQRRLPPTPGPEGPRHLEAALGEAASVPMEVAEVGARVAVLAARIAEEGNPNLLGDAVTAVLLADAGVSSAAVLVAINLQNLPGDERLERVARARALSAASAARAQRKVAP